jgi:hypothetical protein
MKIIDPYAKKKYKKSNKDVSAFINKRGQSLKLDSRPPFVPLGWCNDNEGFIILNIFVPGVPLNK